MRRRSLLAGLLAVALMPVATTAHSPSVSDGAGQTPDTALLLDDPTLSRALGATIATPGEVDWYRMDLQAGDPLVVGMTAPDAEGGLPATFVLLGPGLPAADAADEATRALADAAGADGALRFEPAADPAREVHAGLGFINYGDIRLEAPADGSYFVAVSAVEPAATGKYVLAPGLREEFGLDAIGGMGDLLGFFAAPWPPATSS